MTDRCWRCGADLEAEPIHKSWCHMPNGCSHCGWKPHRWWCSGPDFYYRAAGGRAVWHHDGVIPYLERAKR